MPQGVYALADMPFDIIPKIYSPSILPQPEETGMMLIMIQRHEDTPSCITHKDHLHIRCHRYYLVHEVYAILVVVTAVKSSDEGKEAVEVGIVPESQCRPMSSRHDDAVGITLYILP